MENNKFTNNGVQAIHDSVVNTLTSSLEECGHSVTHPDKLDSSKEQPDMSIDNRVVIEVKVHNPSIEDYESDQKAAIEKAKSNSWGTSAILNPAPVDDAFHKAFKQLKARDEPIKIIALACPLELQMSPGRMRHTLTGLDTISYQREGVEMRPIGYKKTNTPLKKKLSEKIDAVLYIYGKDLNYTVLWKMNGHKDSLYSDLSSNVEDFWDSASNTKGAWV